MMSLKPGVSLRDLQPQIVLAALIVHEFFTNNGIKLTITSCNDGKHMDGSLHYKGLAFDIRTHDISLSNRTQYLQDLVLKIKNLLEAEFDVIVEDINGPNEHMHIEYDPKPIITKLPS